MIALGQEGILSWEIGGDVRYFNGDGGFKNEPCTFAHSYLYAVDADRSITLGILNIRSSDQKICFPSFFYNPFLTVCMQV